MAAKVAQKSPSVDNTDIVSLQISLPQLLELALGTPEVGTINFNILHNFLQVLLHQNNLQTTKVEYRGENAKRIKTVVASLQPEPALRLQEYNITDGAGKMAQRTPQTDGTGVEVLVEAEDDLKVTKGVKQQVSPGKDAKSETIIFVEPVVDGATPTALTFKQLEQSVKELQNQFQTLKDLSTTHEVMERLKGMISDPATDVWQFISINKRLEASEQGIEKLTKMLQDVMKSSASTAAIMDTQPSNERSNELENKVAKVEQELNEIRAIVGTIIEKTPVAADERVDTVGEPKPVTPSAEIIATDEAAVPSREKEETQSEIREEVVDVITEHQEEAAPLQPVSTEEPDVAEAADVTKESRMGEISDDVKRLLEVMETKHGKTLNDITERLNKLENEVVDLLTKVDNMQITIKTDDINELVAKIQQIQTDMERLGDIADKLLDDKESREAHLNTLLDQIEILKTIKADKEDLEDALVDKADAQIMDKKVSHDKFDATCDDLTRGLCETVDKLNQQESTWQLALNELQNDIACKVDKIEMTPLKDFVDTRLKSLQEKLKCMTEMKRESEAAGTKKMLRDVQCISCDKSVVMKTEDICGLRFDALPATNSMRPYLAYKLDQVRKQQKKLSHCKNMIQFESAVREPKKVKTVKEEAPTKAPRDSLSNRYCGGSHTVTTPQQRVLRTGHLLTQWGPEAIQLSEGLVRGKDGQMYRSQSINCKQATCDSICWKSQINEESRCQISQEGVPSVSTAPNKFVPSRRSTAASRKRDSKRLTKELEITEIPMQPEAQPIASPKRSNNYSLIALSGPQDEIIYETNAAEKRS